MSEETYRNITCYVSGLVGGEPECDSGLILLMGVCIFFGFIVYMWKRKEVDV